jgi:hypothetical protein
MRPVADTIDGRTAARRLKMKRWLRRGVVAELIGGCLLLLASRYDLVGWVPGFGRPEKWTGAGFRFWTPLVLVTLGLTAMALGYLLVLRVIGRQEPSDRPDLQNTLLATLLLAAPLFLLITIPSSDVYHYAIYGRIDALYGANPYLTPPARFVDDPLLPLLGDRRVVSVYGPAWQFLARAIALAAGSQAPPALFVLIYKALGLVTLLAGTVLVWAIMGRLQPDQQARAAWLYAANPVCLLEIVGSGHNDGLMVALILLAALAQVRGRTVVALVSLGMAILVKWIALLLLPGYFVWLYRARGLRWKSTRDAVAALALVLALATVLYGRHWSGAATFDAVTGGVATTRLRYSLAAWTALELSAGAREAAASEADELQSEARRPRAESSLRILSPLERRVKWGFVLAFAAWGLLLLPRIYGIRDLLGAWGWTFFAYVCLASAWFWPWYVVWPIALAALAPGARLRRATLFLSMSVLLLTLSRAAKATLGYESIHTPLLIFLPPLLYAAWGYLRGHNLRDAVTPRLGPAAARK